MNLSASSCSMRTTCAWVCRNTSHDLLPRRSAGSASGVWNSVARKKRPCGVVRQSGLARSSWRSWSMAKSRLFSSEVRSRSTRSFEAGAIVLLLTTPKPLGVRTRSREGTARRKASVASTLQAVGVLSTTPKVRTSHASDSCSSTCNLSNSVCSPLTVTRVLGMY